MVKLGRLVAIVATQLPALAGAQARNTCGNGGAACKAGEQDDVGMLQHMMMPADAQIGDLAPDAPVVKHTHAARKKTLLRMDACKVGDHVQCPGSKAWCTGEQCCPPLEEGLPNFPCPSAPKGWGQGHCGSATKEEDCVQEVTTTSTTPQAPVTPPEPVEKTTSTTPQVPVAPPTTSQEVLQPGGSKLVVINACDEGPIWIASMVPEEVRHLYPNNHKLAPNESYTFSFPGDHTVPSTRFWPKMGCQEDGFHCELGTSGGPGQGGCPAEGCAPPVDSKFEATFWDKNTAQAVDWWDTSGVDGYTLPYKLELDSKCPQGVSLDCSELRFADCPKGEMLNGNATDLNVYHNGDVVGCYSTCGKLTYSNWGNSPVFGPADPQAQMYCCPTPPVSSEECRHGPVEESDYIKLFRTKCKNVYSYAYDDAMGLQTCPVGTTYTWTLYCPK